MELINIDEYNAAISKLEQAIANCRFIKHNPEAYQKTADTLRQKADVIATMLESEKTVIENP